MRQPPCPVKSKLLRPTTFAGAVICLGLVVLFGWAADLPWLTRLSPRWNAMQPQTAVSFALAGLGLRFFALRQWRAALTVLLPLAAIPGCALVEHWSGQSLGIDFLLFPEAVRAQADLRYPGRMAEISALEFLLFGLFLVWSRRTPRQYRNASRVATLGLLTAFIGLTGYLFNAHELARVGSYASMAALTAGGFIVLFTGALLTQREAHWLRRLLAAGTAARLARRLLTPILGWPLLLGLALPVLAPVIGNPQLQFALYVVALSLGLVVIVLRFTRRLERAEAQRLRTASALDATQARMTGVLASALDAVITIDEDQRIVYVNPAAEQVFGYAAAELIGSSLERLIPARFRPNHAGHIRRFGETGVTRRSMGRLGALSARRQDGSEFPIEASISQSEADGQKLFTVILRDITERQAAEDRLRASELRFRATFEQAAVGMAHVALDGRWLRVNDRLCRIVGYEREALLRLTFQDITHPADLVADLAKVEQLLAGTIPNYAMEKRYVRRDGSLVWINLTASLVRTPTGEPDYFIAVVEDIQGRKQAEAALQESEERLRLFIRYAPASLAMFDADMRYIAASRRWKDDYFPGEQNVIGRSHYEIFPDVPERWKEAHRRGLAGDVVECDEDCFARADGTLQWLRWEVRPWHTSEGKVGGIVIFAEDITRYRLALEEIRRLNDDLEQRVEERTAELLAANRELDSFAYAVSHDLRAPLRAMSGFSQILEESYGNQLGGEAPRYLQQIRLASRKMGDLIDGILALSRISRGELQRDVVDLSAMTESLLAGLAAAHPERQVDWEVEPGLIAYGDARMLESVMSNLLDNAWKYTAKTPAPSLRVYREGDRFCVADNGAGFDPRHAAQLFEPFKRLHSQNDFPGIGIGLATVQRIIQRHGGEISATAAPGQGATFRFSLGNPGTQASGAPGGA